MVKPVFRRKSIGTKVSEEEYARLEALAGGRALGEWVREVLLRELDGKQARPADDEFDLIELALTPTGYRGWLQGGFLVDPVPIYGNMSVLGILGLPMNVPLPLNPGQWSGTNLMQRPKPCDVSASSLDKYLNQKQSPIEGQGSNLMDAGQKFNVDPRFVVALAGAESTFGKNITSGQYNAWNWFYNGPGNPAPFSGWAAGINSVSRGLGGANYLGAPDGSITNTTDVYQKYCNGPDCSNGLKNINDFLKQQGGDPNSLKFPCP